MTPTENELAPLALRLRRSPGVRLLLCIALVAIAYTAVVLRPWEGGEEVAASRLPELTLPPSGAWPGQGNPAAPQDVEDAGDDVVQDPDGATDGGGNDGGNEEGVGDGWVTTEATSGEDAGRWSLQHPRDWSVVEEDGTVMLTAPITSEDLTMVMVYGGPPQPSGSIEDLAAVSEEVFAEQFAGMGEVEHGLEDFAGTRALHAVVTGDDGGSGEAWFVPAEDRMLVLVAVWLGEQSPLLDEVLASFTVLR